MSERMLLRVSLAVSAGALVAVVALVLVGRGGGSSPASQPITTAQQQPPVRVEVNVQQPNQQPQVLTTTSPTGTEPPAASAPQEIPAQRFAAPLTPAEAEFWRLVDATRASAGRDTSRQSELLRERLERLSPQAIVRFEETRRRLDRRAYTWKLLGAASVIEDGCSDDCFRDFRAYVISLGRNAYERAVRDPDSLASVLQDSETGDWENADDVAPDAYSSVTGNDFPFDDSDLQGAPAGSPINLSDGSLILRYPRLAARFRGPLGS